MRLRSTIRAALAATMVLSAVMTWFGEDGVRDSGSVEAGKVVVGEVLPDLRLPTLDRKGAMRLSSLRGKKVLLIEFASW